MSRSSWFESHTYSGHGDEMRWTFRVIFQFSTKSAQIDAQVMIALGSRWPPHSRQELLCGHNANRTMDDKLGIIPFRWSAISAGADDHREDLERRRRVTNLKP